MYCATAQTFIPLIQREKNNREISPNQRNTSLIYGQKKIFFELKKVLLIQKIFL